MKKRKILISSILLVFIIILYLTSFKSYSKFKSNKTGSGNINIAEFNVKINNHSNNVSIDLKNTITTNNYCDDDIVPGSTGAFALNLDFSSVEVSVDYEILLNEVDSIKPPFFNIYINSSHTELLPITGTHNLSDSDVVTFYIYWEWDFINVNNEDWMDENINLSFDINLNQII